MVHRVGLEHDDPAVDYRNSGICLGGINAMVTKDLTTQG